MSSAPLQNLIIRRHRPVLAIAVLATLGAAVFLVHPGLKADYRLEAFVATTDRSYERFRAFMEEFTSNEFALVAVHGDEPFGPAMEAVLGELTGALRALPAVQRCSSILDLPAWLRSAMGPRLLSHPMLAGNLISEDRKTAAILCGMAGEGGGGEVRRRTVARMKEIVAASRSAHAEFEIMLAGPYVTLIDMYAYVDRDLLVFSALAFLLTVLTMWAVFRRWPPMAFAAGVATCAILCTLGLTIALGVVTSLITQMLVILVIVLAVANCVHLAVATEETALEMPAADRTDRVRATLGHMLAPCTAVMLTTAAGFASVSISEIAPVRRFGIFMAFGLLLALVVSMAAVVVLHRRADPKPATRRRLTSALDRCAAHTTRHKSRYVAGFVIGVGVLAAGTGRLRFESDFVKNFRPHSEVRRSYRFIERHLSPLGSMEVVVRRGDGQSAATAAAVRTAHDLGEEVVRRFPMVKKALTIADPLTLVLPGLPDGDEGVRGRLALVRALPGGQRILRNFINAAGDALRLNFRCIEGFDVQEKLRAAAEIEALAARRFGPDYDIEVTGLYYFYAGLVSNLLRDQYRALGLTIAAIFALMWIMLGSLRLTCIAMSVNLLPVVVCLGAMGWAEVPVNMTTAMMLSVTLGIAVDDTLHYIWRLRRELAQAGDLPQADRPAQAACLPHAGDLPQGTRLPDAIRLPEAIRRTHRSVGKACVFTTVVITGGFSILMLSQFLPTAYFGGLVGFTMLAALAADLLLLPALILLFKPIK